MRHLPRLDGPQRDGRGAQGDRNLQRHRSTSAQEPARSRWSTEARPTSKATRRSAALDATTWRRRDARAAIRLNAAKHPWKGDCAQCHQPGEKFTFTHPSSTDCQECHTPGEKHFRPVSGPLPPCKTCHPTTGSSWKFSHPGSGADCVTCHKPPANHYPGACPPCHQQVGDTWAFSHPEATADCASCHTPPANHYEGQCSACHHRQGVSWKFSHPSSGEHSWKSRACKTCHPKSYTAAYCTCHGGNAPRD